MTRKLNLMDLFSPGNYMSTGNLDHLFSLPQAKGKTLRRVPRVKKLRVPALSFISENEEDIIRDNENKFYLLILPHFS